MIKSTPPEKSGSKNRKALGLGLGVLVADQVIASAKSWSQDPADTAASPTSAEPLNGVELSQQAEESLLSDALLALDAQAQADLALVSGVPDGLLLAMDDEAAQEVAHSFEAFAKPVASETNVASAAAVDGQGAPSVGMALPESVKAELTTLLAQAPVQAAEGAAAAASAATAAAAGEVSAMAVLGGLAGLAVVAGAMGSNASSGDQGSDVAGPTAKITLADKILTVGETTTVTITFSEAVKGFELSDLTAQNGVLSDLVRSTNDPLVWTAKFTPDAPVEDVSNLVVLSANYTDLAGNLGAGSSSDNYIVATKLAGGTVADGYVSGATVFRDLDGDGVLGAGEDSVTTGSGGVFSGLGGYGGSIIALGGTDISTGLAFEGVLKAPAGAAVINPLTTLVSAAMGDTSSQSPEEFAASMASAEAQVAALLGIDDAGLTSITQVDPIALVAAGGAGAEAALDMQLSAIQTANVLVTITQTLVNSGVSENAGSASDLVSGALGQLLNGIDAGGSLNLSDASVLGQLFESVAELAKESGGVDTASLLTLQAVSAQASSALASVNAKIDAIDTSKGIDGLKEAVAAQLVVLGADGLLNSLNSSIADTLKFLESLDLSAGASAEALSNALAQAMGMVNFADGFSEDKLNALIQNNLDDVKDVVAPGDSSGGGTGGGGGGDGDGDNDRLVTLDQVLAAVAPFDPDLNVTLQLSDDDMQGDYGTVNLDKSLSALAVMGIDTIEAATDSGLGSVEVAGYGSNSAVTGLVFDEGLDVTLQLTNADAGLDGDADGTVSLNTSLSALAAMGIDAIEADRGSDVASVVVAGYGTSDEVTGLVFDEDLDVTLQLTGDDADLDEEADGTVSLNTSLSALAAMGIDTIEAAEGSGVTSVVVAGYGTNDEVTGLVFDDNLDVTLQLTGDDADLDEDADGTVSLNTSLSALAAMGIDTIEAAEGSGVTSVVVAGYGTNDEVTGLVFDDNLDVTLQLTGADDELNSGGDADGSVSLNTSLSALSAMGIDTIEAAEGSDVTKVVVEGFGFSAGLSGLVFDDNLDVTLQLTADDADLDEEADGTVTLNTSLSTLAAMGIDTIEADGGSGVSSVVVAGYGTSEEVTGLVFDDNLDVTLELTREDTAMDSDGVVDTTVNLNTSLSALSAMGIDTIGAAYGSLVDDVVVAGYGSIDEVAGLVFDDNLDVTLELTDTDDELNSGGDADGSVSLNTSLSDLAAMGIDVIDTVSGDGIVNVMGGIGGLDLDDLNLIFQDDLSVTLTLTEADASVMLQAEDAQESLRNMGIDLIVDASGNSHDIDDDDFFNNL